MRNRPWVLIPVLPLMVLWAMVASGAQLGWSALRHLARIDRDLEVENHEW